MSERLKRKFTKYDEDLFNAIEANHKRIQEEKQDRLKSLCIPI
jgi:hypothetical protein